MIYILSFLFCGTICAISQFFLEKTKLTPGHINSSLVVIGCILSGFKVYDIFIENFGSGATVPIMNFGHLLVTGASEGYMKSGIIGLFNGVLNKAGPGISVAILSAFIVTILFKIRD